MNIIQIYYIHQLRRQLYRFTAIHNSSHVASWDSKVSIASSRSSGYLSPTVLWIPGFGDTHALFHLLYQGWVTPVLGVGALSCRVQIHPNRT